eukprot:maker-scaffold532_size145644-snap-gene-0.41 protein:Tk04527 transcript:maker-scaffold532_size145644-snap-gene-0.41-mRNA-1 annotation:"---NA---"
MWGQGIFPDKCPDINVHYRKIMDRSAKTILVLFGGLCAIGTGVWAKSNFKSCSTFGANSNELCQELIFEEIIVKIGVDGTNEDCTIDICSDLDKTDCCTTDKLKSLLSDDWSSKDTETWSTSYFGKCKNKKFTIQKGPVVTLSKEGKDSLSVDSITFVAKGTDKKNTESESFVCKNFTVGGTQNPTGKQTQQCGSGPHRYFRVQDAKIQVGAVGTSENVYIEIGSDTNNATCENKMHHSIGSEWEKEKLETFDNSDFGDCGKTLFKVLTQPRVAFRKDGTDALSVSSVKLSFDVVDPQPQKMVVNCPKFDLICPGSGPCRKELLGCTIVEASKDTPSPSQANRPNQRPTFAEVASGRASTGSSSTIRSTSGGQSFFVDIGDNNRGSVSPSSGGSGKTGSVQDLIKQFENDPTLTSSTTTTTKKPGLLSKLFGSSQGKVTTTTTTTTTTTPTTTTTEPKKSGLSALFG